MDLLAPEIRVLGCLLEKQRATPDAYPLTLNSLRLACNQATNREPVVQYSEAEVRDAAHRLERRGLVRFASGAGSRAAKFRHLLSERLPLDDAEQAVMCVLMLRGAQTPGELKQRGERLHPFADLAEVERTLEALIGRELVARLPRRPGQKEERYLHLLGGEEGAGAVAIGQMAAPGATRQATDAVIGLQAAYPDTSSQAADSDAAAQPRDLSEARAAPTIAPPQAELAQLRERVAHLEREMQRLKQELGVEVGS